MRARPDRLDAARLARAGLDRDDVAADPVGWVARTSGRPPEKVRFALDAAVDELGLDPTYPDGLVEPLAALVLGARGTVTEDEVLRLACALAGVEESESARDAVWRAARRVGADLIVFVGTAA